MENPTDFETIWAALCAAGVRFVVVGGVAVVLQGHPRVTADLDLVVALDPPNALAAIRSLASLGFRPRVPVDAEAFADPAVRQSWIDERNLVVLSFWSDRFPATEVDLFAAEPLPFEDLWRRASRLPFAFGEVTVASIADLIAMKERVGRPVDLQDAAALRALAGAGVDG